MNSQLDEVKKEIAAIQHEIKAATVERKEAKEKLEKAITEGKPTGPYEKLLESATAELTRLGKKEEKLMEKEIQLTRPVTNPGSSSVSNINAEVLGSMQWHLSSFLSYYGSIFSSSSLYSRKKSKNQLKKSTLGQSGEPLHCIGQKEEKSLLAGSSYGENFEHIQVGELRKRK
jgi:thymidine phosphorylase